MYEKLVQRLPIPLNLTHKYIAAILHMKPYCQDDKFSIKPYSSKVYRNIYLTRKICCHLFLLYHRCLFNFVCDTVWAHTHFLSLEEWLVFLIRVFGQRADYYENLSLKCSVPNLSRLNLIIISRFPRVLRYQTSAEIWSLDCWPEILTNEFHLKISLHTLLSNWIEFPMTKASPKRYILILVLCMCR